MPQPAPTTPDAAWFEDRVLALLPDLLAAAGSMADQPADAEDLVAEAVARAWERRSDLRARDRFRGWLFTILKNCCRGRVRRRRSEPERVPLPDEGEDSPSFSIFDRLHQPFLLWWGNPEEEFFDGLLREDLVAAMRALPPAYRRVVLLADVHGFRYADIAGALEIPVGTVRSRLARGRSRMQELLWRHAMDRGLRPPEPDTPRERTGESG